MIDVGSDRAFAARIAYLRRKADFHFERSKEHYRRWRLKAKYDPNQPRIPAGQPGGGRWRDGDGVTELADVSSPQSEYDHGADFELRDLILAARRQRVNDAECLVQYRRDTFHCNMVGLRSCHAQAAQRYAACLAGHPIPPLNY
jgi:hypothetical protein